MRKILVVDDDPVFRELLAVVLGEESVTVEQARDGLEALEAVERLRPEVVVLDLMMPGLDGWGFLAGLRSRPDLAGTEVVVVTGSDDPADREKAAVWGCSAYLVKPFSPTRLIEAVTSALKAGDFEGAQDEG